MLSLKIKIGGNLMCQAIACGGQYGSESFCSLGNKCRNALTQNWSGATKVPA